MATHSFSSSDSAYFSSANEYRKTINRAEQLRLTENAVKNVSNVVGEPIKKTAELVERPLRQVVRQDEIGHEMYSTKMMAGAVKNTFVGVALIVAGVAVEAMHNKSIMDAQERSEKNFSNAVRDSVANQGKTLSEYTQRVSEANGEKAQRDAQSRLDQYQAKLLDKSVDSAASMYKSGNKTASEMGRELTNKYGSSSEKQLVSMVADDIKAEMAAKKRGESYTPTTSADERQAASSITQKYAMLSVGKDVVREYGTRDESNLVNKVAADIKAESKAMNRGESYVPKTTASERAMAIQISQRYSVGVQEAQGTYNVHVKTPHMGKGAERFATEFAKKNSAIGHDLALFLGSKKEVELIQRVDVDRRAESLAKQNNQHYNATTSASERNEVERIIQKYAGNIKNQDEIKSTIHRYEIAVKDILKEKKSIQASISQTSSQISAINPQIFALKNALSQYVADKEALKTNMTADGKKLTAEQRKNIMDRVKKMGDVSEHKKQLMDLESQKKALINNLNQLNARSKSADKLISGVNSQIELLKRGGKAIANTVSSKGGQRSLIEKITNQPHISLFDRIVDPVGSSNKIKSYKKQKKNAGSSKAAMGLQAAGVGMIFKSIKQLDREFQKKLNDGNDIHKTIMKDARSLSTAARYYGLALTSVSVGLKVASLPGKFVLKSCGRTAKLIVDKTRLSGVLQSIRTSRFGHGASKVASRLGAVARGQANIAGKLIKAPVTILSAPMMLMNLPQTLAKKAAMGTMRFTRKTVGKVVGGTARLTGKAVKGGAKVVGKGLKYGINHTIGKQKWYKKASGWASRTGKKIAGVTKKVGEKIAAPFNFAKKAVGKICAFIIGIISSIVSFVISAIMYIVGALSIFMLFLLIIMAIVVMLASVFKAILDWINSLSAKEQALVKNDPQYIMNQAVNYRNSELEIFELFYQASSDKSLMRVNDSPIYYALYDTGFHWFGYTGEKELITTNNGAKVLYNKLAGKYKFDKNLIGGVGFEHERPNPVLEQGLDWHFKSDMPKGYDNIKLSYYLLNSDNFVTNSNGSFVTVTRGGNQQYKLKANAVASQYELSNAKDALALVDTIYTSKSETMQKIEVLSYLGVGDYQIAKKDSNGNQVISPNLFWATHTFIYNSGNLASDIWYHATSESEFTTKDGNGHITNRSYPILRTKKYTGSQQSNGYYNTSSAPYDTCGNAETLKFKYHQVDYLPAHQTFDDFEKGVHCHEEYDASNAIAKNHGSVGANSSIMPAVLYYNYNTSYFSSANTSRIPIYNGSMSIIEYVDTYVIATNRDEGGVLSGLHSDSNQDVVNLIMNHDDGISSLYYAVDKAGQYLGTVYVGPSTQTNGDYQISNDIFAKFEYDGSTYDTGYGSGAGMALACFQLRWDGSRYCFDIIGSKPLSSKDDITTSLSSYSTNTTTSYYIIKPPSFNKNAVVISCTGTNADGTARSGHARNDEYDVTVSIEVCRGHVDLDVAMAVSVMDDNGTLFNDAMKVEGLQNDTKADNFLGLFTTDTKNEVSGWGTVTYKAYHPYEDWAEGSELREIAKAKNEAKLTYQVPSGSSMGDLAVWVSHRYSVNSNRVLFPSLAASPDNLLLFGMCFDNKQYYVESFVSGEQKNISYFRLNDTGGSYAAGTVDFKINQGSGIPYVYEYN